MSSSSDKTLHCEVSSSSANGVSLLFPFVNDSSEDGEDDRDGLRGESKIGDAAELGVKRMLTFRFRELFRICSGSSQNSDVPITLLVEVDRNVPG